MTAGVAAEPLLKSAGPEREALPYSSRAIDRLSSDRCSPERVDRLRRAASSRVLVFHGTAVLAKGGQPVTVGAAAAPLSDAPADGDFLLGALEGTAFFARDLSHVPLDDALAATGASDARDVRTLYASLPANLAAIVALGRGLLHWHRAQRHCGRCGVIMTVCDAGMRRRCGRCNNNAFPRIEPAVILAVETPDGEHCLLVRHRAGSRTWSTIAGFVEIGESLEDAARREAREEVGVELEAMAYLHSQPWPFPAGLMVAFIGRARDLNLCVDGDEVGEAAWKTRDDVRRELLEAKPSPLRPDSIETALLRAWVDRSR